MACRSETKFDLAALFTAKFTLLNACTTFKIK